MCTFSRHLCKSCDVNALSRLEHVCVCAGVYEICFGSLLSTFELMLGVFLGLSKVILFRKRLLWPESWPFYMLKLIYMCFEKILSL